MCIEIFRKFKTERDELKVCKLRCFLGTDNIGGCKWDILGEFEDNKFEPTSEL